MGQYEQCATTYHPSSSNAAPGSIERGLRLPANAVLRRSRQGWGKRETSTEAEEDVHSEDTERAGLSEIVQVSQTPNSRDHMIRRRCRVDFARLSDLALCSLFALPPSPSVPHSRLPSFSSPVIPGFSTVRAKSLLLLPCLYSPRWPGSLSSLPSPLRQRLLVVERGYPRSSRRIDVLLLERGQSSRPQKPTLLQLARPILSRPFDSLKPIDDLKSRVRVRDRARRLSAEDC